MAKSRNEIPDPRLTDVAFRFLMPDDSFLTVKVGLAASSVADALEYAVQQARGEALLRIAAGASSGG